MNPISRRILNIVAICGLLTIPSRLIAQTTVQLPQWPMHVTASDGTDVTIFQPQLEDFQGDMLSGRAAVAVVPQNQEQPTYGAVWLQSRVETDRVSRTVRVTDVNVTKVLLPTPNGASTTALASAVKQAILAKPIVLSLDHLLESVEAMRKEQSGAANLQTTPPAIVFRDHPAVLVQYDGDPAMQQVSGTNIDRVINTPFFVALDQSTKLYYLKGAGHWFASGNATGPFAYTTQTPWDVSQLADMTGYTDPAEPVSDDVASKVEIVTATEPTELIWTDGQPQLSPIASTQLLYWANTDSDVFVQIGSQQMFVLLSGRWFTANGQGGPWTFVAPNQLPADFAKIPANSPKASVLAQVAGTPQAADAVADTEIPQTAQVNVNDFQQPTVTYNGPPDFEAVQGTGCSYAVNTDACVLLVNGVYYCCEDGVWFQSSGPTGPWALCLHVPRAIYTLPPSCPDYPASFCDVYGEEGGYEYCGYTPGYVGCYAFDGVVCYGTGYHYNCFYHKHYFPRPCTYGFAARYHPYSGHWGFSVGLAAGGGAAWVSGAVHAHPRAWFGYGGYRPSMARAGERINQAILEANTAGIRNAGGHDVYGRDVYQRRSDARVEASAAPARNEPMPPEIVRGGRTNADLQNNNVFVNDQGDVYRRSDTGWERREGNDWRPQPTEERRSYSSPEERGGAEQRGGAPERDYQVRQQSESRSRSAAPSPAAASHGGGGGRR